MSKSLKRVTEALSEAGLKIAPLEMSAETRTAQQAADAAECEVDQIAKSVILAGAQSGKAILFITAGSNTVDVAKAIGVTYEHPVLMEYVSQELHQETFDALTAPEQAAVRADTEERYLSYVLLRQSGKQHTKLKTNLQDKFTTGDNRYPKTRQQALHLLDKHSKTAVVRPVQSEGSSFAQANQRNNDSYDKKYWKNKTCYNCKQKGHPANHCPNDAVTTPKDDDEESTAKSVSKLRKDLSKMSKKLNTVNTQLKEIREDSDISDSEESIEGSQSFQLQFTTVEKKLNSNIDEKLRTLCKQSHEKTPPNRRSGTDEFFGHELNLRKIILLDNESTMDLFCYAGYVQDMRKADVNLRLKSNGGTMRVTQQATVLGYEQPVWYDKNAITNIIALKNIIKQYRVTYDSNDKAFKVLRQAHGKPDMLFRMHPSGLHYYDPRDTFASDCRQEQARFHKKRSVPS